MFKFKNLIAGYVTRLIFLLFICSTIAHADDKFSFGGMSPTCYTYPAVSMTPYDQSIQNRLYRMTHEQVYHGLNKKGTILLYGPVQPWNDSFGDGVNFNISFIDSDGPGTDAQVTAQLRHIGPGGIRIIKTLRSNDHAFPTDEVQRMTAGVRWEELSRTDGYYVVRLYIDRKNFSVKPAAFGYSLCSAIW